MEPTSFGIYSLAAYNQYSHPLNYQTNHSHSPNPHNSLHTINKTTNSQQLKHKYYVQGSISQKFSIWKAHAKYIPIISSVLKFTNQIPKPITMDFSIGAPNLHFLQTIYNFDLPPSMTDQQKKHILKAHKNNAISELASIIYVSYRKDFPPLLYNWHDNITDPLIVQKLNSITKITGYTSDAGWGCMIRAGQMLLANGLFTHSFFPKKWNRELLKEASTYEEIYWFLLNLILDCNRGKAGAFSIQNIAELGIKYDKKPGEWYGPATITQIFHELNLNYRPIQNLSIITFPDGIMYKNQILEAVTSSSIQQIANNEESKEESKITYNEEQKEPLSKTFDINNFSEEQWEKGIIIFIANRLGLHSINPEYYDPLKRLFDIPYTIGFIGGKENSALYIIGYQKNHFLVMDPHFVQKSINEPQNLKTEYLSYHTDSLKTIPISKLDTSIALGFYLRTYQDYTTFISMIEHENSQDNCIIQLYDKPPSFADDLENFSFNSNEEILIEDKENNISEGFFSGE